MKMVPSELFICISSLLMMIGLCAGSAPLDGPSAQPTNRKRSSATQAPPPVSQSDIYSQLSEMNDLCEKVLDCVTEYENLQQKAASQTTAEESLLLQQRCNLMKSSCLTILYVAEAAEKAAYMQLAELAQSL